MTANVPVRRRFLGLGPLGLGVLTLAVAILAFGASVPMLMLADSGWPWNPSVRHEVGGPSTVELVHHDGREESFSGTAEEVDTWLLRRNGELKEEYGLDTRITIGRVLNGASFVLFAAAVGLLLWWMLGRLRVRPGRTVGG